MVFLYPYQLNDKPLKALDTRKEIISFFTVSKLDTWPISVQYRISQLELSIQILLSLTSFKRLWCCMLKMLFCLSCITKYQDIKVKKWLWVLSDEPSEVEKFENSVEVWIIITLIHSMVSEARLSRKQE